MFRIVQNGKPSKSLKNLDRFKKFGDFFWAPNMLCLSLGIDINRKLNSKWKPLLFLLTTSELIIHIYLRCNLIHSLYHTFVRKDMKELMSVLTFVIYAMDSNMKLSSLFYHRDLLLKTYNVLKQHYPISEEELVLYRVNEHHAASARPTMVFYNYIACCLIILGPLLESGLTYAYDWLMLPAEQVRFIFLKPVPVAYSFDYTKSAGIYALVYMIEYVNCFFTVNSLVGSDMWLLCLMVQIIMHFEYIARRLEVYEPRPENERKDCQFLAEIIEKHQLMLTLYKDLNVIFGFSLATNLFTTSCLLCFVAVQLTVQEIGVYFMKYCLFQITIIGSFYIIYRYGQQLTTSSTDIAEAAYRSAWYNGSRAYKKLMLTLMIRAQKQAELSAKGYQKVSLNTFQSVMIMSYRVFAVLQSAISKNWGI